MPVRQAARRGPHLLILSQALLNIFTVLGLAPPDGSAAAVHLLGLDELMVLLGSMGLLLNVARAGLKLRAVKVT